MGSGCHFKCLFVSWFVSCMVCLHTHKFASKLIFPSFLPLVSLPVLKTYIYASYVRGRVAMFLFPDGSTCIIDLYYMYPILWLFA